MTIKQDWQTRFVGGGPTFSINALTCFCSCGEKPTPLQVLYTRLKGVPCIIFYLWPPRGWPGIGQSQGLFCRSWSGTQPFLPLMPVFLRFQFPIPAFT